MSRGWLRRARGSIRLRVAVIAASTFAVALVVGALVLLRTLESRLVDDVRRADQAALAAQAVRVATEGLPPTYVAAETLPLQSTAGIAVRLPESGEQRIVATVLDEPPGLGGTSASRPGAGRPPAEGTFMDYVVSTGGAVSGTFEALLDPESAALLGVEPAAGPIIVSSLAVGDGVTLTTASTLGEVRRTLDTMRTALWFAVPALVALVGTLAWLVVGRALRPVHDVTSRVASIGSASLHERVPVPYVADEVGELATTMNSMLERLESATLASRRLVSDASHELRTPITVIRTELEVARQHPEADWRQVSDDVLGEVDRLQELVDDLLLLARLGERGRAHDALPLDDMIRDVAARRRRVPVVAAPAEAGPDASPPEVRGDVDAVQRALDHLVANAARHASTAVSVSAETLDATCAVAIHVDDDGPGIPVVDRGRVLERFVRLDEARTRDAGGSGLGLAVVADVMAAHDGRVEIADAPAGGARVTLVFPALA